MGIFYMFVGVSGCGKSTFSQQLAQIKGIEVFSSDTIRKELYGDETIQTYNQKVFEVLHKRVRAILKAGNSCVYDATNLSHKRRKNFLKSISDIKDVQKICYVVATPFETCIERDRSRERTVGEDIIRRQISQFQIPTWDEGWDNITVINPYDAEYKSIWDYFPDEIIPHDCAPYHHENIGEHMVLSTKYLMDNFKDYSRALTIACSLHDIGKFYTKTFYDKKGNLTERARYYGHENWGAYLFISSKEYAEATDKEKEEKLDIALYLIALHMELYKEKSPIYEALPDELKEMLLILKACDEGGRY